MPDYDVFGGRLRSELDLPQLTEASDTLAPTWTLATVASPPEPVPSEVLGEEPVMPGVTVRLYRSADGFRLRYDDTGTFDVSVDGATIVWTPGPKPDPAHVCADVLGRVLAVALHITGRPCLHGSAVALPTGAIAFLGPKHYGKSTLAMATLAKGARLLADDSLPLDLGPPVAACPGFPGVRLWDAALARLTDGEPTVEGGGGKRLLTALSPQSIELEPQPLRALYLLAPHRPAPGGPPLRRELVPPVLAAVSLVRHAKIGALLGKSEAPVLLDRVCAVASRVPVYRLHVVRDLDCLDTVVERLLEWHADGEEPPSRDQAAPSP